MPESKITKYDKLIRDRIPEIIEASNKKAVIEVLGDEKFINYLNLKLSEELDEYMESGSIEELADIVEVVYAILDYKGVSLDEFEQVRLTKAREKGTFTKKLILKYIAEIK